ncbi:MAG: hypothetical protein ACI8WA_001006, partial [Polaribacter sp.]
PPTLPFQEKQTDNSKTGKKIQRIVVFYTDGTFEEYKK